MTEIQWDDSLSVGIDLIDDQHKMLIARLNDLSKAVEDHQEAAYVMRTIDFLIHYTDFHFSAEEVEMEKSGYPPLEEHKVLHAEFKTMLKTLENDMLEEGATRSIGEAVNNFLWNWLSDHIKKVDKGFGKYLAENK